MTKSIIITYQEADESFLMTFFKKLDVKTNPFKNTRGEGVSQPPSDHRPGTTRRHSGPVPETSLATGPRAK